MAIVKADGTVALFRVTVTAFSLTGRLPDSTVCADPEGLHQ
jgi:hypothetical protein